jgi:putative ABC transport system permease protein
VFRRTAVERELVRELRFHVDQQVAEYVASGMNADEAARAAQREFGSGAFVADTVRDARGLAWLDVVTRDAQHAARRLARDWRFTTGAGLILALGIGINTAVFSVVNATLLRPLAFRDSHELVNIYQNNRRDGQAVGASYPAYLDIAAQDGLFAAIAAFSMPLPLPIKVDELVRSSLVEFATSSYMPLLGQPPALGRWFDEREDGEGGDPVAVIGYETWRTWFGASPQIIGTTIHVGAVPVTVIGVGPEGHNGSLNAGVVTNFWMSVSVVPMLDAAGPAPLSRTPVEPFFLVKARLRDGVGLAQVRAAMDVLGARLKRDHPNEDPGRGITVLASDDVRIHPQLDSLLMPGASLLLILVSVVLAIACSNLATLLLVRGSSRASEVALRLAIGGTRGQLVRLLLCESVVLALAGGAAGYLLAEWAIRMLSLVELPLVVDLRLDYRVLGFTLALSVVTGLAFGLAPALRATRVALVPELRNEGSAGSAGRRWFTMRNGLIVGQIAASCLLLVAAGLVVRALLAAERSSLDPGFDIGNLAFIETDAGYGGYTRDTAPAFYDTLRTRISALPGVANTTLAAGPPLGGFSASRAIAIDGYEPAPGETPTARLSWAGPGYFETLGIPMLHGRTFSEFDDRQLPLAVVNEMMARRYFGTPNAVGRRFRMTEASGSSEPGAGQEVEVIGVIPTVRTSVLDAPAPHFYRSFNQARAATSTVVVRTMGPPAALLPAMQRVVREFDARLPVTSIGTMPQLVSRSLGVPRAAAGLLLGLGALGLVLASVGLYAVVAFAVSRRAREIGIRIALGAQRRQVMWVVSRDVATLLGVGLTLGVGLSWLAIQALAALAVELSKAPNLEIIAPSTDLLTFTLVGLVMAAVGLTAAFLPARRASHPADPVSALRHL